MFLGEGVERIYVSVVPLCKYSYSFSRTITNNTLRTEVKQLIFGISPVKLELL